MVWSKKSSFRKYCRERAKITLKFKKRTKLGVESKRKLCPYHDKKQHRACARLESCPADYVSRARCGRPKRPRLPAGFVPDEDEEMSASSGASSCGSAVAAAVAQETFISLAESNVEATQAERPPTPLTPPDEVVDNFRFRRNDSDDDFDPDPHPDTYASPARSTRSWARFEHGNTHFFMTRMLM